MMGATLVQTDNFSTSILQYFNTSGLQDFKTSILQYFNTVSLLCDLVYQGLVNLDSVFAADEAWRRCGRVTPLVTVSSPGP